MSSYDPPAHAVRAAVAAALAEDVGPLGDLTAAVLPADRHVTAEVVARTEGIVAGTACMVETFAQLDPRVAVEWMVDDGGAVGPGTKVGRVAGPLAVVLTGERTALNFLCHLSGVATTTHAFMLAAGGARIWDTRKTLPGLRALEKAAVRAGGGVNHRGTLSDFVLIKDNHLAVLEIADAVARARARWPARTVEVECERRDQVVAALAAGADLVMLDNMVPGEVRECVALVRATASNVLVEVSGGVTLATVREYADTGVDLISTSTITQSAPALDIGLDIDTSDAKG